MPCGACQATPPHFDATRAAFRYAFPVEHIVQALKYRHRLPLAGWLAEALLRKVDAANVDCIMPLPLSARRMRERGFNQAQEIARPLARSFRLPLLADAVRRVREGVPQASLPWQERRANIRHAFECHIDLTGKRIAVVDDVMTTGATLDEFARVLKRNGAARVENWVATRTLPG
jgi:ComF family protein